MRLGDSKKRETALYGMPGIDSTNGKINCLAWRYIGDILYDEKTELHGEPLAFESTTYAYSTPSPPLPFLIR